MSHFPNLLMKIHAFLNLISHQRFYLQSCTIIRSNQIQFFGVVLTGGPRKRKEKKNTFVIIWTN